MCLALVLAEARNSSNVSNFGNAFKDAKPSGTALWQGCHVFGSAAAYAASSSTRSGVTQNSGIAASMRLSLVTT